jgi:hypothetical protein
MNSDNQTNGYPACSNLPVTEFEPGYLQLRR